MRQGNGPDRLAELSPGFKGKWGMNGEEVSSSQDWMGSTMHYVQSIGTKP